jgi:hypothetical protein
MDVVRVDLDAVERHIEPFNGCPECKTREMVAELRAAREVVEAARRHECGAEYQATVWAAIVFYDQAVGS